MDESRLALVGVMEFGMELRFQLEAAITEDVVDHLCQWLIRIDIDRARRLIAFTIEF